MALRSDGLRDHRHDLEEPLVLHARASEGVGVDERERDDDDGARARDEEAVRDGLRQGRGVEVERVVRQPDEVAFGVEKAARDHHVERNRERDQEEGHQQDQQDPDRPVVAVERGLAAWYRAGRDPRRHAGSSGP
jgi:hypothetical protein